MLPIKPVTVREGRGNSSALSAQSLDLPGGNWDKLSQVKDSGNFLIPVGTSFVERDVLGISEEVNRVSKGKCKVASCSCGKCVQEGHFPHVVLELGKDGRTYPVFGFTTFGPEVIQRVREIHVSQDPHKKAMRNNRRIREAQKQKAQEVQQERLEVIETALRSTKFDWRGPSGLRSNPFLSR